jgi:predicted DNA-binding transcriptional regulator AlpA
VGRKIDVDQLVGAAEIAARLGSKRTVYVHDLRRRHPDFPKPVAQLSAGLVWAWPDVEAWARSTGRIK